MKLADLNKINLADLNKINLSELNKRKDILIVAGIILLSLIVANKSIYQVQKRQINYLKREIKEEETKSRLIKEMIALNKRMESYQKRLPLQKNISWLMGGVTRLAKDAQIKIISFQPKKVDKQEGYLRIPLAVRVSGDYHELGGFLEKIESAKEFIKLDSLNLNIAKATDEAGKEAEPVADLVVSTIYME